ncbi:MAG: Ferredoxin, 2Fe-2S [uncultured Thermomicrobiales bacterium]|uniref:Ferredoxin, 2Fe-2S n=1 Tax=uncultured Thermomicrobiales bacterium TaxID=1645740 RepID=A0A6J4U705_9BACT|nr:MAG: Ferredoxin, 2Fe-2S [uncultured Thermomicrobiales bacterium]
MAIKLSDRLIEAMPWLDGTANAMHKAFEPVLGQDKPRAVRDALYGVWLGHPLHSAVITLPIGFWTSTMVFDVVGEKRAADLSLNLGIITALGAAATGAAQWQDSVNWEKPRRLGALHASLNTVSTVLYAGSALLRRRDRRGAGIALSVAGLGVNGFSAWLGGELAYDHAIGVDRTAFEKSIPEWTDLLADGDLPERTPKRVEADGVPVLLFRQAGKVSAISATCTHLGGPLDEGKIEGDTVTCPWHGSVFCLSDGKLLHGPATMPEPGFEVRVQDGRIAVRRA